jgi:hypothetical protein
VTPTFLERLINDRNFVRSPYYWFNLVLVLNVGSILSKDYPVCIGNSERIRWNLVPKVDFKPVCTEGARLIIFEAENENEVPANFWLVTSPRKLKLKVNTFQVEKLSDGTFMASSNGIHHNVKVTDGRIVEIPLIDAEMEILTLLDQWEGEGSISDIVGIISKRRGISSGEVRQVIARLKEKGRIEVVGKTVRRVS